MRRPVSCWRWDRAALTVLMWVLASTPPPAGAVDSAPLEGLDAYIETAMAHWRIPGLAIAVVKGDEVVFAKGFGVAHVEKPAPVDAYTLFAVASNTKAFTATALGLLVQEGQLDWDDPVLEYLPEFQLCDPAATRRITIRDLLCHRSGLGTWAGDLTSFGSTYGRAEIIRRIRFQEPAGEFRASYGYSNLMFLVAGEIILARTGVSWDRFVKERFFDPLGMARTNTSVSDLAGMDNVATPHTLVGEQILPIAYVSVDNHGPAGAINSCVEDMARWLRLQLAYGFYDGRQLVDSTVISETRKSHTLIPLSDESRKTNPWTHFVTYGLGWALSDYEGRLIVSHTGGLDGMYSYTGFMPEEGLGVVVLTNRDNHNLIRALPYHIYDAYLGVGFRDWSARYLDGHRDRLRKEDQEKKRIREARARGTKPSHALKDYVGRYTSLVYGDARITIEDGGLVLHPEAHPHITGRLQHWHFDTFLCEWTDPVWDESFVHFDLDDGRLVRFRLKVRPDWIDTREYSFVKQ